MISSCLRGYQFRVKFESTSPILGLSLRCDRRAPGLVRRALERALKAAPMLDDARLVATELVNNAVLHSGCGADDIIRVTARVDDGFLIISVHDPGVSIESPRLRHRGGSEPGGFGLRIVQQLAHRWGTERPDGHHVWAALRVSTA
jgi:anti-sigma regulatory factor (Ser/Thr protein kinase)